MEPIRRRITLDVSKPGSQTAIYARKGEARVYALYISLSESGEPVCVDEACTLVLRARKPDGTMIYNAGTLDAGRALCYLSGQALAAEGVMRCRLDVYGPNEEMLYSPGFDIYIEPANIEDEDIESTDEFSALTGAMGGLKGLTLDAQEAGEHAERAARAIDEMTVEAVKLPHGADPTAEIEEVDGHKHVTLGLVTGDPGATVGLSPGLFGMYVQNGHLMLAHNDNEPTPPLEIRDGKLIYVIKE